MTILTSGRFAEHELTTATKWYKRITQAVSTALLGYLGDDDWVAVSSFQNSWANAGGGTTAAAYRLRDGVLMIRGTITGGTIANSVAFTMDVNHRPAFQHMFQVWATGGFARVDVYANGDVMVVAPGNSATTPVSLDGIALSFD